MSEPSSNEPFVEEGQAAERAQDRPMYRRNTSSLLKLRQLKAEEQPTAILVAEGATPADGAPQNAEELPQIAPRSPTGTVRRGNSSIVPKKRSSLLPGKDSTAPTDTTAGGAAEPKSQEERRMKQRPSWHTMSLEALYEATASRAGGLSQTEADEKLVLFGKNELKPEEPMGMVQRFFMNLLGPFPLMLMSAGVLCFVITGINSAGTTLDVPDLVLALVLFAVAIITSAFQTTQEQAAENLVQALRDMTAERAWVFRDGELREIDARLLVPGDHVRVQAGEKVPADLRIIDATELKANNAPLTGETAEIKLGPQPNHTDIFEAKNIAWSGCNFTSGNGIGVIFDTGDRTYFGDIAKATTTAEKPDTLMRREVRRLIIIMACIGGVVSISFMITSFALGQSWQTALITLIGLFVANIPEGLMPQLTIALTITARRMRDRKVVVSNLEIIETLGAVSVICSDKTGTLTTNRMTVSHIVYNGAVYVTPVTSLMPHDDFTEFDPKSSSFLKLQEIACLCSDAMFLSKPEGDEKDWKIKGDATESGILRFFGHLVNVDTFREERTRLCYVPFSSARKWMASVNSVDNKPVVLMKGAAERVLARCGSVIVDDKGTELPLTDAMLERYQAIISDLASRGERVLGFARLPLRQREEKFTADGEETNFPLNDLIFIGFLSLVDPPRPSVKPAVKACHGAGIKVIMVTGDHPETAKSIARSIGIVTKPFLTDATEDDADLSQYAAVVTGEDIHQMTTQDWDRVLGCNEQIFARTQPEQKQALVYHLQRHGFIVGMTGDGVNDAPALKAAHVGIAMGSGTAVAKESAQIVITDDDFGSIVVGIKEGRQIFENMKKAVVYIVTHLMPEILPYVVLFVGGFPLAMETIVILFIDLGTDMLPGICLAYEEAEERIMLQPPRSADTHLITPKMLVIGYGAFGLVEAFYCFWGFFWTMSNYGFQFHTLANTPSAFRTAYSDLSSDDQRAFSRICEANGAYIYGNGGNATYLCWTTPGMTSFMLHFKQCVNESQSTFFITLACMQYMHVLCRRQQVMSCFDPRQTKNWRLLLSIAFSVLFMCFWVYTPSVNDGVNLGPVPPRNACSALWGLPVLLLLDELRKLVCRSFPNSEVVKTLLLF